MTLNVSFEKLYETIRSKGLSLSEASRLIGKNASYVSQQRKIGGFPDEVVERLIEILGDDSWIEKAEITFPESEFETFVKAELAEIKQLLNKIVGDKVKAVDSHEEARKILSKALTSNGWLKYQDYIGMCNVAKIEKKICDGVISEAVNERKVRLQTTGYGNEKTKWICKERGE